MSRIKNKIKKAAVLMLMSTFMMNIFTINAKALDLDTYKEVVDKVISSRDDIYNKTVSDLAEVPKGALSTAEKAIKNGKLRIAFAGDSITEGCDVTYEYSYPQQLKKLLEDNLRGVEIEVENFSLGGRGIGNYMDENYKATEEETNYVVNFSRSWSTPGKSWRQCVEDYNPDLLIVAFGMNDAYTGGTSQQVYYNNLTNLVKDAKGWKSKPSMVLVPTILPTKDTALYDQRQNITEALAEITRKVADKNNLAIADAGRLFTVLRDGIDINSTTTSKVTSLSAATDFKNGTVEFDVSLKKDTVSGGDILLRGSDIGSITLRIAEDKASKVKAGLYYTDTTGLFSQSKDKTSSPSIEEDDMGGQIINFGNSGQATLKPVKEVELSDFNFNKSNKVKIEAYGESIKIYFDNKLIIEDTYYGKLASGEIKVKSINSKEFKLSNVNITMEEYKKGSPILTEKEILGPPNDDSISGNGINHPTEAGHSLVYVNSFKKILNELIKSV